jgi:TRAP-type C4-dicarboxylate transport system permease small subunit
MTLTIIDVVLRGFKMPIAGTYELVAFSGAVVIGFAIPRTSWLRAHIFVDFFILKLSRRVRNGFNLVTRGMVFVLFFLIGWNLIKYGMDLQRSGEVSLTLQMPFYPVAYGVGLCSFVQCLVMVCDMVKIVGGKYDE